MWSTLPKSYTKSKKNGCKITMEDIEGIEYHEEDWKRQTHTDSQYIQFSYTTVRLFCSW